MAIPEPRATTEEPTRTLASIARRVLWLSVAIVHHANKRPSVDGLKVGGHQASSASAVSIMTELTFDFLRAGDRLSVKPHASPVLHACQYLLGNLDRRYLPTLRTIDGLQAYPSRTKDPDRVDFSTGSVGLGSALPSYAALTDRYLRDHFDVEGTPPRFVSLMGDAELDEGSLWETVAEEALEGLANVIWIVDLNRQSLDRVVPGIRVERLRQMFRANGWAVIDAKYGQRLEAAFAMEGGTLVRDRIDELPNDRYQRMLRLAPETLRKEFQGEDPALAEFLQRFDDEELLPLVGDLGGHDIDTLRGALETADRSERPSVVFAYTIKGWGLPMAGDPMNHSALLSDDELEAVRTLLGVGEDDFETFPEGSAEAALCREAARRLERPPKPTAVRVEIPAESGASFPRRTSSQQAFSAVLSQVARAAPELAARVVTASPDVSTTTSLGGWINRVGVYGSRPHEDAFADLERRLMTWNEGPSGQHIELGIAENNLFLLMAALGLSEPMFGERLFPIGSLYDPFVARGLDAFIYGLYAGSRFILVATPSGVSLSPEGGAHQSVVTPSIGTELPELTYWEPCFGREVEWILLEALRMIDDPDGGSSYLRLSTRPVDQSSMPPGDLRTSVLSGAYLMIDRRGEPGFDGARSMLIAASGAVVPEALDASEMLLEDGVFASVVNVTSAGRLFRSYQETCRTAVDVTSAGAVVAERWLPTAFDPPGPVVTALDGHPHTMAWLPGALGRSGLPLGVTTFGRSGTIPELYALFRIDAASIVSAGVSVLDRVEHPG